MNSLDRLLATSTFCMLSLIPITPAYAAPAAADAIDPPRWTQEDTTPRQRYETAHKEAAAAQKDLLAECRTQPKAEQSACAREVHANYLQEMSEAKKLLSQ
ncbi:MAG: hypothetical protein EPO06_04020 [Burkholderiaceae bacterium]|nr:MAG: hypothetical protein EPO06_04020 [Burkholderiaceae bacterium]